MAEAVFMPRLGQSVETCIITQWFRNKGDEVKEGDPLFAYETDKAAFEEVAKVSGVLLDVFYEEGDEVPVLATVAVIGKRGESVEELKEEKTISESEDSGADTSVSLNKQKKPDDDYPVTEHKTDPGKIRISPRAKNMAAEHKIPVSGIAGSGPNGRIIARDIEKIIPEIKSKTSGEKTRKPVMSVHPAGNDFEIKPLSNIRKIIGNAMLSSLRNSAQLTHHIGADARKILSVREMVKKENEKGNLPNITLNDMICYAVIKALVKHPSINAHYVEDGIKLFRKVHLGMAVDTDRGLMVPVLRNANDYNLSGLSSQLKSLSESCRKGSVDPDLLRAESASFTVSNLGVYGIEMFTPVLNLPQAGILGINTISYRMADTGDGTIALIPYLGLSLTYDHRVLDGAPASAFLKEIKEQIETLEY